MINTISSFCATKIHGGLMKKNKIMSTYLIFVVKILSIVWRLFNDDISAGMKTPKKLSNTSWTSSKLLHPLTGPHFEASDWTPQLIGLSSTGIPPLLPIVSATSFHSLQFSPRLSSSFPLYSVGAGHLFLPIEKPTLATCFQLEKSRELLYPHHKYNYLTIQVFPNNCFHQCYTSQLLFPIILEGPSIKV